MDANAKAIVRARQIAKDYISSVGNWSDEKAVSRAIEYMGEIRNLPDDPLRNCDVGTPEEQLKRWRIFCDMVQGCDECPCNKRDGISADCYARWSQMPYEKEEGGSR